MYGAMKAFVQKNMTIESRCNKNIPVLFEVNLALSIMSM